MNLSQLYPCQACHQAYAFHLSKEPRKCLFGGSTWVPADPKAEPPERHRDAIEVLLEKIKQRGRQMAALGTTNLKEDAEWHRLNREFRRLSADVEAIRSICHHSRLHPRPLNILCADCGRVIKKR